MREGWDESRAKAYVAAVRANGWDFDAGARAFGVTRNAAESAMRRYLGKTCRQLVREAAAPSGAVGASGASNLYQADPLVKEAHQGKPAVDVAAAPAWQGYAPRAGWAAPEQPRIAKARTEEVRTTVVLADLHDPYVHRTDLGCAMGLIREIQPSRVVLNGDIMEMEALSRHPKSRPDLARLAAEFYSANLLLDGLQNCAPNAEFVFVEGNHEARAPRFACELGALDGLLDVPVGLYIHPRGEYHRDGGQLRGMRWIPLSEQPFLLDPDLAVMHGVFEAKHHAAATAESVAPRHGAQVTITAHMHGFQAAESAAGFRSYACPWLGDDRAACFRAYVKGKPKPWSRGLLYVEQAGPSVSVTHVRIEHGRALVGGRLVAAA